MATGTYFNRDIFNCRSGLNTVSASAFNCGIEIFGMYFRFQIFLRQILPKMKNIMKLPAFANTISCETLFHFYLIIVIFKALY